MQIAKELLGYTKYNEPVSIYCLKNSSGSYVEVLDYGCSIRSICIPDKTGVLQDVCLGYQSLAEYENDKEYFGAAVGRCANLIANAVFALNNRQYLLDKNNGENHLHGGKNGFSFCLWNGTINNNTLVFTLTFAHMSDGYTGNLNMTITYEWTETNQLHITYEARSDQDTILNVTNHTYFNLNGTKNASILNHTLCVNADKITEVDNNLLPTGEYLSVENTPFDFRVAKPVGQGITDTHPQMIYAEGYDHNFVLNNPGYRKASVLYSPLTGIRMTCLTDQPGIQIYTGNGLCNCTGKNGETLEPRSGICLETQHYTNSINIPHFPSVILKANEDYRSTTTYAFDILHKP